MADSPKPHYHGHRQRLRERLAREPRALADYELLELLLGQVLLRQDTKPLAKELLERFGSLHGALTATPELLEQVPGLGPAVVGAFGLWRELLSRLGEHRLAQRQTFSGPEAVAEAALARLGHVGTEEFWVALVDVKNRLIAWERLWSGTVDQAPAYPREILALALRHKAVGVILVHNHPGGDPQPSSADMQLTRRMCRAAQELDVRVLDHLVVAGQSYFSFRENGLLG